MLEENLSFDEFKNLFDKDPGQRRNRLCEEIKRKIYEDRFDIYGDQDLCCIKLQRLIEILGCCKDRRIMKLKKYKEYEGDFVKVYEFYENKLMKKIQEKEKKKQKILKHKVSHVTEEEKKNFVPLPEFQGYFYKLDENDLLMIINKNGKIMKCNDKKYYNLIAEKKYKNKVTKNSIMKNIVSE